jgi:ribokinase
MKAIKVLNFGSLNIDHVYGVPRFVAPGETLATRRYARFAGGKGFNQSIALARAGASVVHVGNIGPDGAWLVAMLEQEGVDVRAIRQRETPTGHAIIQVLEPDEADEAAGENSILIHAGANRTLDAEQCDAALELIEPGDFVLMQNEVNRLDALLPAASARGAHIVLNPSPLDDGILALPLACVGTFVLNEGEARHLADTPDADLEALLDRLAAQFPDAEIVLTLGVRGARYAGRGERLEVGAEPVAAVDTTGAGDTFTGYYVAGRLAGHDTRTALQHASHAAALCVQHSGAADSIPTRPIEPAG